MSAQVLKYEPGQKYQEHWDWFEKEEIEKMDSHDITNRIATILIYLSGAQPPPPLTHNVPSVDFDERHTEKSFWVYWSFRRIYREVQLMSSGHQHRWERRHLRLAAHKALQLCRARLF